MSSAAQNTAPRLWIGIAQSCQVDAKYLVTIAADLGPRDSQRFGNFGSEKRRREFLLGRWILRQACFDWLGDESGMLAFDSTPEGAIKVASHTRPTDIKDIKVSLSHTGNWIACALLAGHASGTGIGIDIESMYERDYPALDEMAFAPGEHLPLHLLPTEAHRHEFYLRWTRHEACFKATGRMPDPHRCDKHSHIIHDSLMISLCIFGESVPPSSIRIGEWHQNHGFLVCTDAHPISSYRALLDTELP